MYFLINIYKYLKLLVLLDYFIWISNKKHIWLLINLRTHLKLSINSLCEIFFMWRNFHDKIGLNYDLINMQIFWPLGCKLKLVNNSHFHCWKSGHRHPKVVQSSSLIVSRRGACKYYIRTLWWGVWRKCLFCLFG